ncbi:MAG TPA: hypothetical protein VFE27_13950 [Acidobacteriaceae bacterium]|jgi:hypothetical protein|nr:hypothetical protein [Acidobacteriaceae bacterium]
MPTPTGWALAELSKKQIDGERTVVSGPHSQMYEAWFGMINPPRDYSVYDMSWVGPAACLAPMQWPS